MSRRPLLTVCIPAYNRARYLAPLLESILEQDFEDFNILICEDYSPERLELSQIVRKFQEQNISKIHYYENTSNLGYDGNIRNLIALSTGEFCVFMGNDDLMCPGALSSIASAIQLQPTCGVVVRSYASFEGDPSHHKQIYRYFPSHYSISPGVLAISTAYRRSVVISGMVINRDAAMLFATNRFDGTLLYQLYLVGMILASQGVVFTPDLISLRRDGTAPDFGNSPVEKGKFVPNNQTPESSIHFMRGMLAIAKYVEITTGLAVFNLIRSDIGSYSYPILSIQAKRAPLVFFRYGLQLAQLGLWRSPFFHAYFLSLLTLGPDRVDSVIKFIKTRMGFTPRFGVASKGKK
jgi:abequosyltransferase